MMNRREFLAMAAMGAASTALSSATSDPFTESTSTELKETMTNKPSPTRITRCCLRRWRNGPSIFSAGCSHDISKSFFEINRRFLDEGRAAFPGDNARVARLSLIDESGPRYVRMANVACIGSHKINGVAQLHSELLKQTVLRDFRRAMAGEILQRHTVGHYAI
jgi:hypothetical protein